MLSVDYLISTVLYICSDFLCILLVLVMTLDEFEKMPVVFAHYFKFKWMKNITRDQKELEG